jgi:hypothetical protein
LASVCAVLTLISRGRTQAETSEQAAAAQTLFIPQRAAWWHWSTDAWLMGLIHENPTAEHSVTKYEEVYLDQISFYSS